MMFFKCNLIVSSFFTYSLLLLLRLEHKNKLFELCFNKNIFNFFKGKLHDDHDSLSSDDAEDDDKRFYQGEREKNNEELLKINTIKNRGQSQPAETDM